MHDQFPGNPEISAPDRGKMQQERDIDKAGGSLAYSTSSTDYANDSMDLA